MIKALTKTIEFERELTSNMKMRRAPEDRGVSLHSRDPSDFSEMDQQDLVENIKLKVSHLCIPHHRLLSASLCSLSSLLSISLLLYVQYRNKTGDAGEGKLESPKHVEVSGMFAKDAEGGGVKGRKPLPPIDFHGAISDAFTPYMGAYVDLERKRMNDLMEKVEKDERWSAPDESKAKDRYGGSDDLFLYIKNSITQCNKLNRNEILYNLYLEYRRGLGLYSEMLDRHLRAKEQLNDREVQMTCYTVNTAEYVADTIPGLENSIKNSIDAAYKDKIDLSGQQEQYSVLINKAVQQLVNSVFNALNRTLTAMMKNNCTHTPHHHTVRAAAGIGSPPTSADSMTDCPLLRCVCVFVRDAAVQGRRGRVWVMRASSLRR